MTSFAIQFTSKLSYLIDFPLQKKQLDERGSVLNGLFDDGDGLVVVLLEVVVLTQVVVQPQESGWGLEVSLLVVGRVLRQVLVKTIDNFLDDCEFFLEMKVKVNTNGRNKLMFLGMDLI